MYNDYYAPKNVAPDSKENVNRLPYADFRKHISLLQNNADFKDFKELARNHVSIGKYALKVDIDNSYHLWPDLYNNIEILLYIISEDLDIFWEIVNKITNKELFYDLVAKDDEILEFANSDTYKNKERMLHFIKCNNKSIHYVDKSLFNDMDFIKWILKINWLFIKWLTTEIKNNKELAMLAISNDKANRLKDSYNNIWNTKSAYSYISDELKHNIDVVKLLNKRIDECSWF